MNRGVKRTARPDQNMISNYDLSFIEHQTVHIDHGVFSNINPMTEIAVKRQDDMRVGTHVGHKHAKQRLGFFFCRRLRDLAHRLAGKTPVAVLYSIHIVQKTGISAAGLQRNFRMAQIGIERRIERSGRNTSRVRILFDSCFESGFIVEPDLAHFARPAEFVFDIAPLNAGQRIVQLLGEVTCLEVIDNGFFAFVAKFADWRNNGCGTGTPRFLQSSVTGSGHQIVNGQMFFVNGVAKITDDVQNRVAGYARQYSSVNRSGPDFAVDQEHDVHASDFFDIFLVDTVQPENPV